MWIRISFLVACFTLNIYKIDSLIHLLTQEIDRHIMVPSIIMFVPKEKWSRRPGLGIGKHFRAGRYLHYMEVTTQLLLHFRLLPKNLKKERK